MNPSYYIPIIMLLVILFIVSRTNKNMLLRRLIKKRKTEDRAQMTELARGFIDKECIIYTFNGSQIMGTVKEVTDGALLIEKDGVTEAVNIDFVMRLREHPRKKNGKKKSVIID